MAEQPKAKPPGANQYVDRGSENPEAPSTLASQGIDKNLANRAMTSKRVDAVTGWDMQAEVGLFLTGVGTALILVALIALIWSMVPR